MRNLAGIESFVTRRALEKRHRHSHVLLQTTSALRIHDTEICHRWVKKPLVIRIIHARGGAKPLHGLFVILSNAEARGITIPGTILGISAIVVRGHLKPLECLYVISL